MKKLFFLFFISIALPAQAQKYDTGAMFLLSASLNVKSVGKIEISEKEAIFGFADTVTKYEILKKVNGLVYITDGVMTHTLSFSKKTGKMKGFAYDTLINFSFDKKQKDEVIMYYAKENK